MTNLSTIMDDLNSFEEERILIGDILDKFENRGFAVILFIIAIPLALPIPAPPPLNFLFGIPLLFLTGQIILGFRKPWLPTWIRSKGFSRDMVDKSANKLGDWLKYINRYVKPRGGLTDGFTGALDSGPLFSDYVTQYFYDLPYVEYGSQPVYRTVRIRQNDRGRVDHGYRYDRRTGLCDSADTSKRSAGC